MCGRLISDCVFSIGHSSCSVVGAGWPARGHNSPWPRRALVEATKNENDGAGGDGVGMGDHAKCLGRTRSIMGFRISPCLIIDRDNTITSAFAREAGF